MADLQNLLDKVIRHLAQREDVTVRWLNPPTSHAAGEIVKTEQGLEIFVGELTSTQARLRVLLHEIAHARLDADWIPETSTRQPVRIIRDQAQRTAWRKHPRELRAQQLSDEWLEYADNHAFLFWRAGRTELECKLLSLLNWRDESGI